MTVSEHDLEELHDRAADNWEPLFVIAETAGSEWLGKARKAALALEGVRESTDGLGVRLLADLRAVWSETEASLASAVVCDRLKGIDEAPWGDWNKGKGLTAHALANQLRPFGIQPRSNGSARGYQRPDFEDAWSRYLSQNGAQSVKPSGNGSAEADTLTVAPPSGETSKARAALEAAGVRVWVGDDGDLRTDPPPVALDETEWALLAQAQAEHRAARGEVPNA